MPNLYPAEKSPTCWTPFIKLKIYLFDNSIIIVKRPAGKNGNPNFITFFNMIELTIYIDVLFKIIGDDKIKTEAEAIKFAINTPETP